MADTLTPEQRHNCMSHIKGKNTKPEILVRRALFQQGYRYRINVQGLAGHPDIVLNKHKTVIFINGCFWHGHEGCKKSTIPKTNTEFWINKIENNKKRDQRNIETLIQSHWNVIIIWECELTKQKFDNTLNHLLAIIKQMTPCKQYYRETSNPNSVWIEE